MKHNFSALKNKKAQFGIRFCINDNYLLSKMGINLCIWNELTLSSLETITWSFVHALSLKSVRKLLDKHIAYCLVTLY